MRIALAFVVASLTCTAAPSRAADATFTLDAVLSAPFADELTASPRRDALVWTVHERGARNVAVWKDGTARKVTHSTADDGEELDAVQFVPDDTAVVYARGGAGQDGDDKNPNPTAPAQRQPRKIFLTSVASGATIELGEGKEPAVSPRGDRVVWIGKDDQVTSATIASSDGGKTWTAGVAGVLFTVRGSAGAPLWSPDGTRLAITDRRGDHSYIAIYALGAPEVAFAAPGFSNDVSPAWSPDGTHIAFVRLPGDIATLSIYDDPSSFPPWSIVVADAATGRGGIVWRAPRGRGYEFNIADGVQPLWWSRDGRLAFVWERDGWRHLYGLQASGGTPRLLTPGAYDVEQIASGADGATLLYTSNENALDRRHVWRVGFDGTHRSEVSGATSPEARHGTPAAGSTPPNTGSTTTDAGNTTTEASTATSADGAAPSTSGAIANEWSPVALSGGRYAFLRATYNHPGIPTVVAGLTQTPLLAAPIPAEFPADALVEPRAIVFDAPDGLPIHGQLFLARDGRKQHPALIFVHGGPERQMLTTFHYFEAYSNLYELNQYLVSRGFDVLSVNYRSGIMYGHDFFEPPKRGQLGASEYQDVLAGAHVLAARADVDPKRIGIYGLSYGGYLTALALARNSDIFAAGADQAGVHDWRGWIDSFAGRQVGTPEQRATAFAASPIADVATWRSPVYLDAGDDDRNVPFAQTVTLAGLLDARGVDVTLHAVPDELHEYTVYAHELDRFTRTADFLITRLHAR